MHFTILTLFPEYFTSILETSQLRKAVQEKIITVAVVNIRDFASDAYKSVDDRPYGGGAGMVMKIAPIASALASVAVCSTNTKKLLFSARGTALNQDKVREYAKLDHLVLVCGHYTDVDQRVGDYLVDEEVRIGDYVLTGGEPAAAVLLDAVSRLLPGVLGNEENLTGESFSDDGVLSSPPQYTRPEKYRGWEVPQVLLQGDHQKIQAWKESKRTRKS